MCAHGCLGIVDVGPSVRSGAQPPGGPAVQRSRGGPPGGADKGHGGPARPLNGPTHLPSGLAEPPTHVPSANSCAATVGVQLQTLEVISGVLPYVLGAARGVWGRECLAQKEGESPEESCRKPPYKGWKGARGSRGGLAQATCAASCAICGLKNRKS